MAVIFLRSLIFNVLFYAAFCFGRSSRCRPS